VTTSFLAISAASAAAAASVPARPSPAAQPVSVKQQRELRLHFATPVDFVKDKVLSRLNSALAKIGPSYFVTARALPSGDVIAITDSPATRTLTKKHRDKLLAAFSGHNVKIHARTYTVIVHGIIKALYPNDQQKDNIASLDQQNPQLKGYIDIRCTYWRKKALAFIKTQSSLLVDVTTPAHSNHLIANGLIAQSKVRDVKPFDGRCLLTRCFHCQSFAHTSKNCRRNAKCSFCAPSRHTSNNYPHQKQTDKHRCANYNNAHAAMSTACPKFKAKMARFLRAHTTSMSCPPFPSRLSLLDPSSSKS
ncbi:hypothetical protein KEM56_000518, partial [Ascosphaera pollenicola]